MFQFGRFPYVYYFIHIRIHDSSSCGLPHSEIHGYIAYLQLPVAYRSLSRPSSAPDAKAFALCSYLLELLLVLFAFIAEIRLIGCVCFFSTLSGKIAVLFSYHFSLERPIILCFSLLYLFVCFI